MRLRSLKDGSLRIDVKQVGERGLIDLNRVEVMAPDGAVQPLKMVRWGAFTGRLPPSEAMAAGSVLRVVGVDQALNHTTREVQVP